MLCFHAYFPVLISEAQMDEQLMRWAVPRTAHLEREDPEGIWK